MNEAANTAPPTRPMAIIGMPAGTPPSTFFTAEKLGTVTGGAGVKVGRRVCVGTWLKAASSVGSIVDVASGVGVLGGSTIRKGPPLSTTLAA